MALLNFHPQGKWPRTMCANPPTAGSVVLAKVIALAFLMVVIGFAIPQVAGQIAAGWCCMLNLTGCKIFTYFDLQVTLKCVVLSKGHVLTASSHEALRHWQQTEGIASGFWPWPNMNSAFSAICYAWKTHAFALMITVISWGFDPVPASHDLKIPGLPFLSSNHAERNVWHGKATKCWVCECKDMAISPNAECVMSNVDPTPYGVRQIPNVNNYESYQDSSHQPRQVFLVLSPTPWLQSHFTTAWGGP